MNPMKNVFEKTHCDWSKTHYFSRGNKEGAFYENHMVPYFRSDFFRNNLTHCNPIYIQQNSQFNFLFPHQFNYANVKSPSHLNDQMKWIRVASGLSKSFPGLFKANYKMSDSEYIRKYTMKFTGTF